MGGGGGFGYSRLRTRADLIVPGQGMRLMFRGSGGPPTPTAEPGTYTVTVELGDKTFTRPLVVDRKDGYEVTTGFGFEEDGLESFLERLKEGGH